MPVLLTPQASVNALHSVEPIRTWVPRSGWITYFVEQNSSFLPFLASNLSLSAIFTKRLKNPFLHVWPGVFFFLAEAYVQEADAASESAEEKRPARKWFIE